MGQITHNKKPQVNIDPLSLPHTVIKKDLYQSLIYELFKVRHPSYKNDSQMLRNFVKKNNIDKTWVYYPWKNTALCIVPENEYLEIKTARNRNLISNNEQLTIRKKTIGVAGLSIGSAVVSVLASMGSPGNLKLADFDTVELSNLNRMHANLLDVGENKAWITARRVWEIDPYINLEIWDKGVSKKMVQKFLLGESRLDVFIDAIDDLILKVQIRILCKKFKIPVLMATSNGFSVIIDIERYDQDANLPIFNGRLGKVNPQEFSYNNYDEWLELANSIVGLETMTKELKESIPLIGQKLAGVPQLSSVVNYGGIILADSIHRIVTGKKLNSGRIIIPINPQ